MPDKSPLQLAKEALDAVIAQKKQNQDLVKSLGPAIIDILKPVLNEMVSNSRLPKDELLKAISNIKIPEIKVPEPNVVVNIPNLPAFPKIPEPKVTVNMPPIKIPEIKMPEEMDIKGWVKLQGIDLNNPLPVQLRDSKGKAVNLLENLTTLVGLGGGGPRIGEVSVDRLSITSISDGIRTTTSGTAVSLVSTSTPCKKITVTALPNNTDLVVVGSNTVVASSDGRRGYSLYAGSAITLEIDNVNKVFIDSIITGEGISFIYLN